MPFSIATWNINSVRLRLPLVKRFVESHRPDVICLQETKVRDSDFPFDRLRDLGYDHIEISGQKGYHGVATLSRHPLTRVVRGPFCREGHSRHLAVTLADGVAAGLTIHNFYVPAGATSLTPRSTRNSPTSSISSTAWAAVLTKGTSRPSAPSS